jgi:LysR family glycine cleavage system transcriptional activator
MVDYLFNQVNTPVCSPALLRGKNPLNQPGDLRHHTLLHVEWKDAEASWRMWLLAAGLHDIDPTRGPHSPWRTWRCRPRSTARAWL